MAAPEWNPEPLNVGLAGLSVSMRLLDKLVEKKVLTSDEVMKVLQDAIDRFVSTSDRKEAYEAIKAAMPNISF